MCSVSRREFLIGGSTFLSLAAEAELLSGPKVEGISEAAEAGSRGRRYLLSRAPSLTWWCGGSLRVGLDSVPNGVL
jgi:hypothetical protein